MSVRSLGTVWSPSPTKARIQLEDIAYSVLSEALSGWSHTYPQVDVEPFSIHGDDPARTLLELADKSDADLIVVGSREHDGAPVGIIGSVSQALVTHAQMSVAVVRLPRAG
jgi:nucleotide-binding universal stress UspA family protein